MRTSAGISRTPFIGTVHARVCECGLSPKEMGTAKTAQAAVDMMSGYWSVYVTFFGDQMVWLHFTVSDMRDGTVVWRDGAWLTQEGKENGDKESRPGKPLGRGFESARWIVSGRAVNERPGTRRASDGWPDGQP